MSNKKTKKLREEFGDLLAEATELLSLDRALRPGEKLIMKEFRHLEAELDKEKAKKAAAKARKHRVHSQKEIAMLMTLGVVSMESLDHGKNVLTRKGR